MVQENLSNLINSLNPLSKDFDTDDAINVSRDLTCRVYWGATRWCFVFPNDNFVYKIPRFDSVSYDYCAREMHNYDIAKEYRVEKILLQIERVASLENGINIYKQQKFDFDHYQTDYAFRDKVASKCENTIGKASRKSRWHCYDSDINPLWYNRMVQLYGKKFARSFEKFTHKVLLNDLHQKNIGWIHGKPIILDFAGYNGSAGFSESEEY